MDEVYISKSKTSCNVEREMLILDGAEGVLLHGSRAESCGNRTERSTPYVKCQHKRITGGKPQIPGIKISSAVYVERMKD